MLFLDIFNSYFLKLIYISRIINYNTWKKGYPALKKILLEKYPQLKEKK